MIKPVAMYLLLFIWAHVYILFVAGAYIESIDRGHLAEDEVIPRAGGGKIARIFHRDNTYL